MKGTVISMKEDICTNVKYLISYDLQFFAKDDGGDKTEEPTTKKLSDARKEGQVAKSTELITASGLLTLFVALKIFVGYIGDQFIQVFHKEIGRAHV